MRKGIKQKRITRAEAMREPRVMDPELFRETFSRMHASDGIAEEVLNMSRNGSKKRQLIKKSTALGMAAALAGTVAVMAATVHHWTRGMQNSLQGTTEQMQELEQKGLVIFPHASVTDEGVTITVDQCIVNGSWGHIALKISGFDLPQGTEPDFEAAGLRVEDYEGAWSISGGFDDGLQTDGYQVIGRDGKEPETEADGSLVQYWQDEKGDLEFIFSVFIDDPAADVQPSLSGKTVDIDLAGLGYLEGKTESKLVVPGTWHFNFALPASDDLHIYENLDQRIGNTDAVLQTVELSPISVAVTCRFPRKAHSETGYHEEMITEEDGSQHSESIPFTYTEYEEPPKVAGVKLEDGTMLFGIDAGPGSSGYISQTEDIWVERFGTGKILEPEKITALLFLDRDTLPEDGEIDVVTEENCIEVPIGNAD